MYSGLNSQQLGENNTEKIGKKIKRISVSFCFIDLILFWIERIIASFYFNSIAAYKYAKNAVATKVRASSKKYLACLCWSVRLGGVCAPATSFHPKKTIHTCSIMGATSIFVFKLNKIYSIYLPCFICKIKKVYTGVVCYIRSKYSFNLFNCQEEWGPTGL